MATCRNAGPAAVQANRTELTATAAATNDLRSSSDFCGFRSRSLATRLDRDSRRRGPGCNAKAKSKTKQELAQTWTPEPLPRSTQSYFGPDPQNNRDEPSGDLRPRHRNCLPRESCGATVCPRRSMISQMRHICNASEMYLFFRGTAAVALFKTTLRLGRYCRFSALEGWLLFVLEHTFSIALRFLALWFPALWFPAL